MVEHFRSECPIAHQSKDEYLIYRWMQPAVISGVYFLVDRGVVVYIGKSFDVHHRGCTHIRQGNKQFDSIYFIKVDPDDALAAEGWFLAR